MERRKGGRIREKEGEKQRQDGARKEEKIV